MFDIVFIGAEWMQKPTLCGGYLGDMPFSTLCGNAI